MVLGLENGMKCVNKKSRIRRNFFPLPPDLPANRETRGRTFFSSSVLEPGRPSRLVTLPTEPNFFPPLPLYTPCTNICFPLRAFLASRENSTDDEVRWKTGEAKLSVRRFPSWYIDRWIEESYCPTNELQELYTDRYNITITLPWWRGDELNR